MNGKDKDKSSFNLGLVASALSSILESPVVTYDDYVEGGGTVLPQQIISINSIHKSFLVTEEDIVGHNASPEDNVQHSTSSSEDNIQHSVSPSHSSSTFPTVNRLPISPTINRLPISPTINRLPISPTINRRSNYYPTDSRQISFPAPVSIQSKPHAPPPPPRTRSHEIQIFVSALDSKQNTIFIDSNATVLQLKHEIHRLLDYDVPCQRIIFDGKQLNDDRSLSSYNIQHSSTVHLVFRLSGGLECYIITSDFLDPKFDFDFTNITDNQTFTRGGHLYKRPCGWKRLALNISIKYGSGDWLGVGVRRNSSTDSVRGEWPVSYHGTLRDNVNNIVDQGYLLSKGRRFSYGKGIYSTPDIDVAARFAKVFTHEGVNYKMVFQNRVNPENMKKISLEDTGIGEYWVSPNERDIRPYGICYKRV